MRLFFMALIASALMALSVPAQAGSRVHGHGRCTSSDACKLLHSARPRGRIPVACVHIPFIKIRAPVYGPVNLYVLRDFHEPRSAEDLQQQLRPVEKGGSMVWEDSKVTGPADDFCRNAKFFARGTAIVLCDEHSSGWIVGNDLRYAIRTGWPPRKRRVEIGKRG